MLHTYLQVALSPKGHNLRVLVDVDWGGTVQPTASLPCGSTGLGAPPFLWREAAKELAAPTLTHQHPRRTAPI